MLLFLYLFSGLIALIRKSGGISATADWLSKYIRSEKGVFYILWALIPVSLFLLSSAITYFIGAGWAAAPYNFGALGIAALLFLIFGLI
ncbi:MAG: hypothetical protein COV44_07550 [Deltaproteobacteria bacterium CG11_big_fil_rev_8_21_14_0_20_45_16]|nr:MAG: hypothetical protein COV44_07550 [Deltaproteobacteria bacterium CG11_big_fil_rev_8_21_14_0_20_45_16]